MIDPATLATILQSAVPVSAIQQAPAQLAAMNSGGINNINSVLSNMGANKAAPSVPPAPTTGGLGGLGGMKKPSSFKDRLEKVKSNTPQHHSLISSGAQFVPLEAPRTNPYATTASGLFEMLQNMYGA